MTLNITASWHKASFDHFLLERLPQLLAERLPLVGYHVEATGSYTCRVSVTLNTPSKVIEIVYRDIPQPDEQGIFEVAGKRLVVVPRASQDELDLADIFCVGEQLHDYVAERLGEAPAELPWDESLVHAWFPLGTRMHEFFVSRAQVLDQSNWLATHQHLRRLFLKDREKMFTPGHFGRTCPFETPEGPNIGRYLTIAVGAAIRDSKLVILDERPEAGLGLSASLVPFLEHDEPNRLLMGTNMMRQWMVPPDPEPALVQTGNEPNVPDFWCGRNLLTAYISWGADTFEDGITISESCAKRLSYPYTAEPGDKLSNRHGTKGVISRILPDEEMPHLADGTPVELVYSFLSLHRRMYPGQLREAVMSRIARFEGTPALVAPFHAPAEREIRQRLVQANLAEDGMETLSPGCDSKPLPRPSTVGWVYWGRLFHTAPSKIQASVKANAGQKQGELEYYALRDISAFESIRGQFNTCVVERAGADGLAERVAESKVEQAGYPTPMFADLVRRLAAAGIQIAYESERLILRFASPGDEVLKLAQPLPHPWLHEHTLTEVGIFDELPEYGALVEANNKMARMLNSQVPDGLTKKALAQLETRLQAFFAAILTPAYLRFSSTVLFSGRAVLVPEAGLSLDQVGIAEEMAWTLFGPLVIQELGDRAEVHARSVRATRMLDEIMARTWLLVHRAPAHTPTSFLAFHPVRFADHVIRLHPLACGLLNTDFDGDMASVFLPITQGAQHEAGERLSVAGHLKRDPGLLELLVLTNEAMWGLASLSLTAEGREEILHLVGTSVAFSDGFLTRTALIDALRVVLERDGIERTLAILEELMRRGFEVAKGSGASMSPFIGASLVRPLLPQQDGVPLWQSYVDYAEEIMERIALRSDFMDNDLGPQLLSVKSEALGQMYQLAWLVETRGAVKDVYGQYVPIRHGFSTGLAPEEMYALAVSSRENLARIAFEWEQLGEGVSGRREPKGFNVLARAMRSRVPGVVFALAAAIGETDPLSSLDSRLFVGLPVTSGFVE